MEISGSKPRALFSVHDKEGIVEFGKGLVDMNWEILASGKTAIRLQENNIPVIEISNYTGLQEMLDDRVKTLHPKIHAGILAKNVGDHRDQMTALNWGYIDMVVVNFYPFQKVVAEPNIQFEDAIKNIDIGGPTMLKGAAKNFERLIALHDPTDYAGVLKALESTEGMTLQMRFELAKKVFQYTFEYEKAIKEYFENQKVA